MLFASVGSASAAEDALLSFCQMCQSSSSTWVCNGERFLTPSIYHSYSGGQCEIKVYKSSVSNVCDMCGYVIDTVGMHECIGVHMNCGMGIETVCRHYTSGSPDMG